MKFLLAKKVGMTNVFDDEGVMTPVTVLEAGPCVVTQVKTDTTDGYSAVQIGFGQTKKLAKPQLGHQAKAKATNRFLTEFRVPKVSSFIEDHEAETPVKQLAVGDKLDTSIFEVGDMVTVRATSKGKGFAGTIKRHNFSRGPKTHGSKNYRKPGSIGSAFPEHVFKGQKMAGQMGGGQVTVKNLQVVKVDPEHNVIAVKGAVPGPKKSLVRIEENK